MRICTSSSMNVTWVNLQNIWIISLVHTFCNALQFRHSEGETSELQILLPENAKISVSLNSIFFQLLGVLFFSVLLWELNIAYKNKTEYVKTNEISKTADNESFYCHWWDFFKSFHNIYMSIYYFLAPLRFHS